MLLYLAFDNDTDCEKVKVLISKEVKLSCCLSHLERWSDAGDSYAV